MSFASVLLALLAALSLSLAWCVPGSLTSVFLGWLAAFCWLWVARVKKPYRVGLLAGLVTHLLAFFWLNYTISHFGGFGVIPTGAIFLLFAVISSLQFWVFILLFRLSPALLERFGLRTACAWVLAELCAVRIFPWHLGHTQIAFTPFVQVAEIVGAAGVSFAMLWIAELIVSKGGSRALRVVSASLVTIVILGYGLHRAPQFDSLSSNNQLGASLKVTLVQGNISLAEKHDSDSFRRNIQSYIDLSRPYVADSDLVIWPETVVMEWIYEGVGTTMGDQRIPWFANQTNLLLGSLSYRDRETFFNSIFAVLPDGTVPLPYHKNVLMPFGEYTPFGDYLPWLRELNSTAADFEAGTGVVVFELPLAGDEPAIIKVAPLICYEDVVTSLAIKATKAGANLLVNQTNDAWFGDTIAPYQHHLIASFRAIENRRYLLRTTNTGLTAVVDPLGRTVSQLPTFQSGVLSEKVYLVDEVPLFVRLGGNRIWWVFFSLYGLLLVLTAVRARVRARDGRS